MDNLSHSVASLAVGELLHRSLQPEAGQAGQRTRRQLLLFSTWAAGNFPDLDLFLTPLLPEPLGYLLHHRGHTHTLLYAIPQGLLLWAAILLAWPSARRLLQESASARRGLLAAIVFGLALHLLMDFLNSYGIHPFHPFDSRWLYGDMVFIVEPFFWVALGVPLAMMVPRALVRWPLLIALLGMPVFFAASGYLAWGSVAALAAAALVGGALQRSVGPAGRGGLVTALSLCLAFIAVQALASGQARRFIADRLERGDRSVRVLDVSLTAFPANPLCWTFVSVEINAVAGTYALRRGLFSTAPDSFPVSACPPALRPGILRHDAAPGLAFMFEESGKQDALRILNEGNCHFAAWMRFARTPSVRAARATDIRFGVDPDLNFSTLRFEDFDSRDCPAYVPRWDFPRGDLLLQQGPADAR